MFITFDVSPDDDGPGILLGFTDARTFDPLPPAERRERALAGFAALFGDEALQPIDYVDHCWGTEEFAPGGPTAAVPPGSWTTYGPWLRKPVDGIFWAGTETADEWTGFLDGAVRSGQRAAAEVRRRTLAGLGAGRAAASARTDSTSPRSCPLTSSGRSRIAQCPPDSSTNSARLGAVLGDPARRDHRQQPVLLAADDQRRHRQVLQPDVLVRPQRIDQRAGPAAAARGRGRGEQLEDEVGDRRVGVAAHRHRRHEPPAGPVDRAHQRRRAERLEQGARRAHPGVGQRAAARA